MLLALSLAAIPFGGNNVLADKPERERGHYVVPEAYQQPEDAASMGAKSRDDTDAQETAT
jgi:hypothetical protein